MHYTGTTSRALRQLFPSSASSGKNLGQLGQIERVELPSGDFLKGEAELKERNVQRLVWPPEMRRYSVEETTKRALRREGESYYDVGKNNCEHFVMWCMCGMNICLQVKTIHFVFQETAIAIKNSLFHMAETLPVKFGLEQVGNLCDDAANAVGKFLARGGAKATSKIALGVSAGLAILIDTIVVGYEINQNHKKWKEGILIKSREEFTQKVTEAVMAGAGRLGCGIGGMILGQILIPVPFLGAIIGSLLGAGLGDLLGRWVGRHYVGKGIGWIVEKLKSIFG